MSFDSIEKSQAAGEPYELYLFQTEGSLFQYTSADEDIVYLGQTYRSSTIHRDELEETNEVVSGELKVYVAASDPLAALFIPYLPPTPVTLTIFGGHFGDSDVVVLFAGSVASANFTQDDTELVCRSDKYILQRQIPKQLYQSPCAHVFGDVGCTIDLALFTFDGVIGSVSDGGDVCTVDAFASLPHPIKGGWLIRGRDVRMCVDQSGNQLTLISPIASLHVGDAVKGVSGCMHTYAACNSYANVANFLGFDLIPEINPFDGSID